MWKSYRQLNNWDRWQIYALLREWRDYSYIGEKLWFHKSSIGREIERNSKDWTYQPAFAQQKYENRRSEINKWRSKIRWDSETLAVIKKYMIQERWAPHTISGRGKVSVCATTIYTYIDSREPSLKKRLKYKKWYRKHWKLDTRGKPKENYKTIDERPSIVDTRERIWDMEIDTIHSSGSERRWWVVTIVDRKTKFLCGWKVRRREAKMVGDVLIREMKKLPKQKLLTITSDNGKEFYDFQRVETSLKVPLFFANPYASYERPTNEHTNGMLRVFFPKWTDFSKISEEEIQEKIRIVNRKPRKSLNYLCAEEAFYGIKLNL